MATRTPIISAHHEISSTSIALLEPGQVIKPILEKSHARQLVERLYGLRVISVVEFKGYDDRNFFVEVEDQYLNPHIHQLSSDGYVLKITNSLDSKRPELINAQTEFMFYAQNQGFTVNTPVKNIAGAYMSLENIDGTDQEHLVRLLTFIPGRILNEVSCTTTLCHQIGVLVAKFDEAIQGFHHPIYETFESNWMLSKAPLIRKFLHAVDDAERRQTVTSVLDEFEIQVLKNVGKLAYGMIHGDINEHNLIVRKMVGSIDEYEVYGILDFGDVQKSCIIFELALAALYCILLGSNASEWINFSGHVVAGYTGERPLCPLEWDVLKISMEARLCQSLVMGAYTYLQDPTNNYALTTAKNGWEVLKWLRNMPKEVLYDKWLFII